MTALVPGFVGKNKLGCYDMVCSGGRSKKKLSLEFKQCAQLCFFVGGKAKHPPKQNNEASKRQ